MTITLCDTGCPARALVTVRKNDLVLTYCLHHYLAQEEALALDGWDIVEVVEA